MSILSQRATNRLASALVSLAAYAGEVTHSTMLHSTRSSSLYMLFISNLTARFVDDAGYLGTRRSLSLLLEHGFPLFLFIFLHHFRRFLGQSVGLELAEGAGFCDLEGLEPGHVQSLLKGGALVTVLVQEGRAHVDGFLADVLPGVKVELRGVLNSLSCNFLVVFIIEGEHATQHEVADNTKGP